MATKKGKIKRVALSKFAAVRPSGLIAIGLTAGDILGWVRLTSGDDEIIIVTEKGRALKYHESKVRAMGRQAVGVKAITLRENDSVTSMDVVVPGAELLVVTANGYGKRTPCKDYPAKGRGTMGILTLDRKKLDLVGPIASARVVDEEDDLTIISSGGIVLRTKVKQIRSAGRATMGVRIMGLKEGETVASVARASASDLKEVGVEEEANDG
jgi:DNA gyrase subunit A